MDDLDAAAASIQSVYRGYQTRKLFKNTFKEYQELASQLENDAMQYEEYVPRQRSDSCMLPPISRSKKAFSLGGDSPVHRKNSRVTVTAATEHALYWWKPPRINNHEVDMYCLTLYQQNSRKSIEKSKEVKANVKETADVPESVSTPAFADTVQQENAVADLYPLQVQSQNDEYSREECLLMTERKESDTSFSSLDEPFNFPEVSPPPPILSSTSKYDEKCTVEVEGTKNSTENPSYEHEAELNVVVAPIDIPSISNSDLLAEQTNNDQEVLSWQSKLNRLSAEILPFAVLKSTSAKNSPSTSSTISHSPTCSQSSMQQPISSTLNESENHPTKEKPEADIEADDIEQKMPEKDIETESDREIQAEDLIVVRSAELPICDEFICSEEIAVVNEATSSIPENELAGEAVREEENNLCILNSHPNIPTGMSLESAEILSDGNSEEENTNAAESPCLAAEDEHSAVEEPSAVLNTETSENVVATRPCSNVVDEPSAKAEVSMVENKDDSGAEPDTIVNTVEAAETVKVEGISISKQAVIDVSRPPESTLQSNPPQLPLGIAVIHEPSGFTPSNNLANIPDPHPVSLSELDYPFSTFVCLEKTKDSRPYSMSAQSLTDIPLDSDDSVPERRKIAEFILTKESDYKTVLWQEKKRVLEDEMQWLRQSIQKRISVR